MRDNRSLPANKIPLPDCGRFAAVRPASYRNY
jgi:hypothetical protein